MLTYILYRCILISSRGAHKEGDKQMTTLNIQAITDMGCAVYASIKVSEDYTMNEVVKAVKNRGFKAFRIVETMKRFVEI